MQNDTPKIERRISRRGGLWWIDTKNPSGRWISLLNKGYYTKNAAEAALAEIGGAK